MDVHSSHANQTPPGDSQKNIKNQESVKVTGLSNRGVLKSRPPKFLKSFQIHYRQNTPSADSTLRTLEIPNKGKVIKIIPINCYRARTHELLLLRHWLNTPVIRIPLQRDCLSLVEHRARIVGG
jgi:hypothetical protein